jgi:signal transduction histidine kinase
MKTLPARMKVQNTRQLAWAGQAALILLPVVVLSGVALHFLREDRTAIEQDARNRANSLGPDAARQIGDQISEFLAASLKNGFAIQGEIVDGQGRAVPDYPRVPTPSDWATKLRPREAEQWQTLQDVRFQHPNAEAADKALTALSGPGNPTPVRANAQLGLLIAAEAHGDRDALIRQAVTIAKQFAGEVTESGTPVADLALLIALRHVGKGDLPRDLAAAIENNLVNAPSFLSTTILDEVDARAKTDSGKSMAARLRDSWQQQESDRRRTRETMQDFVARLSRRDTPTMLYSFDETGIPRATLAPRQRAALCIPQDGGWRILLVQLEPLVGSLHLNLPDYLGVWLNVEGLRWNVGKRLEPKLAPLAYAQGSFAPDPKDAKYPFTMAIDLTSPELLYAPYRRRLLLTQWLIFTAAAAALLGLWRLWHTYREQTRLNEMKSNLVSSVSHELRAPLAAVRLMAESLESGRVDGAEKQKDYYRLIVRECRRLSSLVENVLDFSRIDQGRKEYHREPLDALALLRHTVMLMEPGAAERAVRIRLSEPPPEFESLQPSWDSEAVEQSMVNLLDNAIKHSPTGEENSDAEVRVEVELLPAVVRFWVIDRGPGIPAEEQQKIFDLFYRYGSELRRETEGVGIGLSIVKHVAEAHGGRVVVESSPGHGSRFGLELPR